MPARLPRAELRSVKVAAMSQKKLPEAMVDVAVMAAIRYPLTYRVPPSLDVRTGQRVQVPLGRLASG